MRSGRASMVYSRYSLKQHLEIFCFQLWAIRQVGDLDTEMGHMIEALHEVEAPCCQCVESSKKKHCPKELFSVFYPMLRVFP